MRAKSSAANKDKTSIEYNHSTVLKNGEIPGVEGV